MNSRALERWLAREIRGRVTPSREIRPRRFVTRGPARNWKYRAWIRTLPCAACGREPSEAAHTGSDGGAGQKPSDYSCVPLCTECHTIGAGAYHRIGRQAFEQRHGLDFRALVRRLNCLWFNQWKVGINE